MITWYVLLGKSRTITRDIYMEGNVAHVVPTIEKSDLDQALSRKRPRSRWGPPLSALDAGRAAPCSPLLTLQVAA